MKSRDKSNRLGQIASVFSNWESTASVATLGIFLPSFLFFAIPNPVVPRLRRSRWTSDFLEWDNISSIALMAAVMIKLSQATLTT